MKPKESVFAGEKESVTLSLNQELVKLIKESGNTLGLSSSDFVNGLLTLYFEERGMYQRHSFHEAELS